jgi:hypothetical protein
MSFAKACCCNDALAVLAIAGHEIKRVWKGAADVA